MVGLGVYTYGISFVPKFIRESTQNLLGPSAQTESSEKEHRHLSVNSSLDAIFTV